MRLMRFRCLGRVYLLATMVALATLNPHSQRIAVAQLDEGGADVGEDTDLGVLESEPNGGVLEAEPGRTKPKSGQPAPDKALQTIDEFQRAEERASGTPEPEPTPRGGFFGK
jgi:hypothetical protein